MKTLNKYIEYEEVVYMKSGLTLDHDTGYLQILYVPIVDMRTETNEATNE